MAKPLEIPLTLETGTRTRGALKDALARSDYGVIYSNALFRLISLTCAQIESNPPQDLREVVSDIGRACDIGLAINNSISESLLPIANLVANFEPGEEKEVQGDGE